MTRHTWTIALALALSLVGVSFSGYAQEPTTTEQPADGIENPPQTPDGPPTDTPDVPHTDTPEAPSPSEPPQAQQAPQEPTPFALEDMSIVSTRIQERPEGLAFSSTPEGEFDLAPTRHLREAMESLPGVVVRQANGPRDHSISIRGSGAKTSFAVRNLKMYEDGIIQTQSDGLSRLDLHDPWFMKSVEVVRGPSSSLYDNYALGGMVHFKSRRGGDLQGWETLLSAGSFGFQKYGLAYGSESPTSDVALYATHVVEDGYIDHSDYFTNTVNLNFRFQVDDRQNFYFKVINNDLHTNVPTRLTLEQFEADPTQAGGLGTQTALSLDQGRHDRRTILGGFYERQISDATVLTMESDFDVKDINQIFSTIGDNINPNFKFYTDLRHNGQMMGTPLRSYLGIFGNYMEQEGQTFNNSNDSTGTRTTLTQKNRASITNLGARVRGDWEFVPQWTAAAGVGYENSLIRATVNRYTNGVPPATDPVVTLDRTFRNVAPELSLTHQTSRDTRQWVRASTGYAIPGIGNLTTGPDGTPGTNFDLNPQKNLGFELGTDTAFSSRASLQLVGFWTLFKDEIITQNVITPTGGVGTTSINADRSDYRGIEVGTTVRPAKGIRITGAYTLIDATYKRFDDQYVVSGVVTPVSRDGKEIPAVEKNVLDAKIAYDHPSGFGGWIEGYWAGEFYVNNSNTLEAPAYGVMHANVHHDFTFTSGPIRFVKAYAQVDNVFDRTYVSSAGVVADSPTDTPTTLRTTKQSFFAGYGRAVYGGITVGF